MTPCPRGCGFAHVSSRCPRDVSVDDATLDSLVQKASIPNLASMYRKAKDSGLIEAKPGYADTKN